MIGVVIGTSAFRLAITIAVRGVFDGDRQDDEWDE